MSILARYFFRYKSLIKFGTIGVVNTLVHTTLVILAVEIVRLNPVLSNIIAFFITNILSYFMNAYWVFSSKVSVSKYLKFLFASATALIGTVLFSSLAEAMNWHYLIGIVLISTVLPLITYFVYKVWVFSR
ncbi:GtrA family protein [Vibrio sp. 10N.222.49.B4]|uniref:GtrA family protein n=1 Tax=Vibrio sp. 10N.222.49.B4 TaxID=3229613 RepID=UPI00354D8A91